MEGFIVKLDKIEVHQCNKCPKVFMENKGLQDHYARHDVQEQLYRERVMKHSVTQLPQNYNDLKPHKCEECGLRFVESSTLNTHLKVHEPFPHICHCGIGFYQAKDLTTHGRLVHPTHQLKIEPPEPEIKSEFAIKPKKKRANLGVKPRLLANMVFSKPKLESRSRQSVLIPKNEDGDYECYLCGQAYTDKTKFFDHIKSHKGNWHHLCDKCPYSSQTLANLIAHKKTHDPGHNGIWKCDICKKIYKKQNCLAGHMKIHTGENHSSEKSSAGKENSMFSQNKDGDYECSFCGQIHKDKTKYFVHINSHTGQWPHVCDKCPYGAKTLAAFIVHNKTHQANHNGIWKCDTCQMILKSRDTLINHTYRHTREKPFACTLCPKSFTQGGALTSHLKRHAGTRNFECDLCKKRFVDKGALILHMRTHLGLKPYNCKDCGKLFSDPSAFQRHRRIHTGEKPYRCKYCPKAFSDCSASLVHTRRHEGLTFTCRICRKQLSDRNSLYLHMKTIHENNTYECDYCGLKTNRKPYIGVHIKIVHQKLKRYNCSYCEQQFYFQHNLKKHIGLVHEKGNGCPICGRMFKTDHARRQHKCISCSICGKTFKRHLDMKIHHKRHSIMKEHGCQDCPRKFSEISALNKHLSECHGKVACDHCGEEHDGKRKLTNHIWSKHMLSLYCDVCMRRFYTEAEFGNHKMRKNCEKRVSCKICKLKFRKSTLVRHLIEHMNEGVKCVICGLLFRCKDSMMQHCKTAH
ncbi:Uncharacterized protein OBRU01_10376 [Operophtera brumata]|uniref:C2H2-type domain-containing protein n=1 Tax=Operophtera brumata TaxID=104452 RepID=A0A0L7LEU8_OPEBR|nr:Uncharacterized protein OBRU01_10376 [Operophtera brumata]